MKKIVIVLTLLIVMIFTGAAMLTGCQETYDNGVPKYFLEPDGYVIASVRSKNATAIYVGKYGYILEEDYQKYLNGEQDGILVVKHPYEEGKEASIPYNEIESINIGEYKDYR